MSGKLVTVVVPTRGRPAQLQSCLEALSVQTLGDACDVVVVDDGSPQAFTEGSIARLARQLDLRVVRQTNAGPAAARNRGVREARGELIAFTDDDCRPEPDWLEQLARAHSLRPETLIGGTTTNGLPTHLFPSASQLVVDLVYEHFNADPSRACFLASNNVICSKRQFLELGGFDESFPRAGAEDRDFCDRWRARGWPLAWQKSAQVEHRHHQTLRKFLALHFRYGRGAYIYQDKRKLRGSGTMRQDLDFHRAVARRLRGRLASHEASSHGVAMYAALCAWQFANASGFAAEAASIAISRVLRRPAGGKDGH